MCNWAEAVCGQAWRRPGASASSLNSITRMTLLQLHIYVDERSQLRARSEHAICLMRSRCSMSPSRCLISQRHTVHCILLIHSSTSRLHHRLPFTLVFCSGICDLLEASTVVKGQSLPVSRVLCHRQRFPGCAAPATPFLAVSHSCADLDVSGSEEGLTYVLVPM